MSEVKNIWCTLVMLKDEYARGAAAVAQSLRNVQSQYPIWCMVSDDISETCVEFLCGQFDKVVHVPLISHPCAPLKSRKQNEIYGSWIQHSFTKWNVFNPELFPVDKVIILDADMLFLENCDVLFELSAPAATFSSPWALPYAKNNRYKLRNPYGEMKHGQIVDPKKIVQGFKGSILGLACMVLIHPSNQAHHTMMELLNRDKVYGTSKCVSGIDEQLLAETLLAMGEPIHHIHQQYNWIVGKTNWLLYGETPKTQQYYNGKPWHLVATPDDRKKVVDNGQWEDVRQWWRVADQVMESNPDTIKQFYPGL